LNVAFYRINVNVVEHIAMSRKIVTSHASKGVLVGPLVVSMDGREWTSAFRRYGFINRHAARQTMADAASARRGIVAALHPILLKSSPL
jgi:hypothetical protein